MVDAGTRLGTLLGTTPTNVNVCVRGTRYFFKTIAPSRKATKQYLGEERWTLTKSSCSSQSSEASGRPPRAASASALGAPAMQRPRCRKDRRLNIRWSSKDLEEIQKRALAEGLPYQTLISSLLHKYAAGRLKEV
jgi:hypothetical protein